MTELQRRAGTLPERIMAKGPCDWRQGALSDDNRGELEVLDGARNPKMQYQATVVAAEDPPANATVGTDMEGALYALFMCVLRRDANFRTAIVSVDTLDDSQTWTVTIDGNAVAFISDATTTAAEIVAGLKAAIDLDGVVSLIVDTAVVLETLVITGKTAADYTIAVSATGAGVLATVGTDATEVTVRGWYKPTGAAEATDPWLDMEGHEETVERNTGWVLSVAPFDQVWGQVVATDGRTVLSLAPCGLTAQDGVSWPTT